MAVLWQLKIADNKKPDTFNKHQAIEYGIPQGTRPPVTAVKKQCPEPLTNGSQIIFLRFV